MKVFVDWVLARLTRSIIVAVVAAPLLSIFSAALIALETARRGTTRGAVAGAGTIGGLVVLAALSRTDVSLFAAVGAVCAVCGVTAGALIRRAGNLGLAYQAAVLICLGLVLLIGVLGIDARLYFAPAIEELVTLLPSEMPAEQVAFVQQRSAALLLATAVFLQMIGTLLLAYWWALLAAGQQRFGDEFRQLKLGRVLGAVSTVLIALGLVFDVELVQNLTPLALLGFLLQGIAVLNAWVHARHWHPALMVPVYLLLLLPGVNVLLGLPISMMGLIDQWFDLRAPLRPQT